jgi:hypothetical protein
MPFQAVAWAWKVPLADPVERCALLWLANRVPPDEIHAYDVNLTVLAHFCGVTEDVAANGLQRLAEKGLIRRLGSTDCYFVALPLLPVVLVEGTTDEWERPPNSVLIPAEIKERVIRAFGGACFACGSKASAHVDHIIPRYAGGSNDESNLQLLCGTCNTRKRAKLGWVPM